MHPEPRPEKSDTKEGKSNIKMFKAAVEGKFPLKP
jgi:hypothetical protein